MKKKVMNAECKGPYDKCVQCDSLRVICDGPRTSSVDSIERWCELMRSFKDRWGYTNEYVAEESKVSLTTISRIMAGNVEKDIRWSTVRAVERVLIGHGSQYPCPLAARDPEAVAVATMKDEQLKQLQETLAGIHASYKEEIAMVREDAAREIALYREKIAALEAQAVEMKTLIMTRGRYIEKLIDKS